MQIHELTKRLKTNEGLLDTMRDGISAVKTGYKQGGLKGAAKASVSNAAMAQAANQRLQKDSEKGLKDLKAKGINANMPLSFYVNQIKNPTEPEYKEASAEANQQLNQLVPQAEKQFVVGPVLPDPGQVLVVTSGGGKYYKDINDKWYNETGKMVPATNASALEALIDNDQYSQTAPPSFLQKAAPAPTKGKTAAPAQTAAQPAQPAQPASLEEARPAVQPGALGQRALRRNAPIKPAASTAQPGANPQADLKARLQSKNRNAPSAQAQTGVQKLAGKEQGIAQQKAVASKPSKVRGKKALKAGFEQWISQSLKDFGTIGASDRQVLNQKFKQLLANKNEETLKDYIITAQAAILKAKDQSGTGVASNVAPAGGDDADTVIQRLKQKGIKGNAVDPETAKGLQALGVPILESQVFITKDIHVKTAKGDYVKRHSDQEWYDPNGVRIDPKKYPEYIAKLDATPQAQTRYQADAEKGLGSDEGVKRAQQAKANQPKPTPQITMPQATAADWEQVRAHRNDMNNAAIDKTINDLRNAEYFNTGQKDYLQQQLAQLMAKKF